MAWWRSRRLAPELAKKGVVLTSLRAALAEHPEIVEKHLGRLVTGAESKLVAVAAALWQAGLFVYVPRASHDRAAALEQDVSSGEAPSLFRTRSCWTRAPRRRS